MDFEDQVADHRRAYPFPIIDKRGNEVDRFGTLEEARKAAVAEPEKYRVDWDSIIRHGDWTLALADRLARRGYEEGVIEIDDAIEYALMGRTLDGPFAQAIWAEIVGPVLEELGYDYDDVYEVSA